MKFKFKIYFIVLMFLFSGLYANSASDFEMGFMFHNNFILGPGNLTTQPTMAAIRQDYILNDLDNAGFGSSFLGAAVMKYSASKSLKLYGSLSYTSWASKTPLAIVNPEFNPYYDTSDSLIKIGTDENSLGIVQFSLGMQFIIDEYSFKISRKRIKVRPYVLPTIDCNFILASASGKDLHRGSFSFDKSYLRIGAGINPGIEIDISKSITVDIGLNYQIPNLLLREDDDPSTSGSEAIINNFASKSEELIHLFSIRYGMTFKL